MRPPDRPHLLGIDDGPFRKHVTASVPLVAVATEGADLVEAVAVTEFPVDGDGVTDFLADWVAALRIRPALQALVLGGITIAGLAVVDAGRLAERLGLPILIVNRRDPTNHRLEAALRAAGLEERIALVERTPPAYPVGERLFLAAAGAGPERAAALVRATRGKSALPEPLRLAHLIARALVEGESRGRP